ncbi:oligopeptide transporter 2, partial [Lipomyces japonicus]|uniref:oligopeptide transporter 2 n=1 Tax=Lipomyces japonicus TaxID=56871 RepID=UPI0034CD3A53
MAEEEKWAKSLSDDHDGASVSSPDYASENDEKKTGVDVESKQLYEHELEVIVDRMRATGDMDDILTAGYAPFFVEKVKAINSQESREVLEYALEYHRTDINFPYTTYDRITSLLAGEEAYGQGPVLYDLDIRLEASLMKYHSPYPEVRAVCAPTDDPTIPVETFRAYVIGLFWVVFACFINQIMYFRQPSFSLTSQVIQLLLLPCGQFAAKFVPAWKFSIGKYSLNLNPGPWTFKEQMFATILTNVGASASVWSQYAPVIRENIFYGQQWSDFGFNLLITLVTQLFGFGMAGVLRRWAIYPAKAVWPTLLPTLQLNRTLLTPERKQNINGWTITKYKIFCITLAASFLYFFVPDYLFTALSTFNWMTWIAPKNKNLAFITGSTIGFGFNPITTFDWSVINQNSPLVVPFFTVANRYAGQIVGGLTLIILYYTNYKFSAHMPPNVSSVYDRFGKSYNLSRVLDNGVLNTEKYQAYSPPYISAGYYMYLSS